jgi:hypothetical protein
MTWLEFFVNILKSLLSWQVGIFIISVILLDEIKLLLEAVAEKLADLSELHRGNTRAIFGGRVDDRMGIRTGRGRSRSFPGGTVPPLQGARVQISPGEASSPDPASGNPGESSTRGGGAET